MASHNVTRLIDSIINHAHNKGMHTTRANTYAHDEDWDNEAGERAAAEREEQVITNRLVQLVALIDAQDKRTAQDDEPTVFSTMGLPEPSFPDVNFH